jgi:hypothetical protein
MSNDIEELLRESIGRHTAGARVPGGMAARARRQVSRRRTARTAGLATAAASAAAAAIAVPVIAAGGGTVADQPGHPAGADGTAGAARQPAGAQHVQTVADVIRHTDRAVSSGNLIMETLTNAKVYSLQKHGSHLRVVRLHYLGYSYRDRATSQLFTGPNTFTGPHHVQIADAERIGSLRPGTRSTDQLLRVAYWNRTYGQTTKREAAPRQPTPLSCSLRQSLSRPSATLRTYLSTSPASIRAAVACGGLAISGHPTVDGQQVIELTGTPKLTSHRLTVDVSPATYLPVRMVFGRLRFDYRWLRPTEANLASLALHPPAGFRRVPYIRV